MELLIWAAFLWIAAIGWAVTAAGEKGLSIGGWVVAVLVFGPFALLVLLLWPVDEMAREEKLVQFQALKRCAECATACSPKARICRACGHGFTVTAPSSSPPVPPPDA